MWRKVLLIYSMISILGMTIVQAEQTSYAMKPVEVQPVTSNEGGSMIGLEEDGWSLQYKLQGNDLYVECIVPKLSLKKAKEERGGHLLIKLNGGETAKMHQAAFILKNVPPGKHQVEIVPIDDDGSDYAKGIEFDIHVPER